MAKAVAKSKKNAEKIAAKSKPSAPARKAAPAAIARKALKKSPAKPAPKVAPKAAAKVAAKPVGKGPVSKPALSAPKAGKWVYTFGDGKAEGDAGLRDLLGGKGANLAEMSNLGLPVPPGLTVTTEVCTWYYANKNSYPPDLKEQVTTALREIGYLAKGNFGDP